MLPRDGGVHSRETSKLLSSGEQQVARTRSFRRVDPSSRYDSATELIYRSGMDVDNTRFSFFFSRKNNFPTWREIFDKNLPFVVSTRGKVYDEINAKMENLLRVAIESDPANYNSK